VIRAAIAQEWALHPVKAVLSLLAIPPVLLALWALTVVGIVAGTPR